MAVGMKLGSLRSALIVHAVAAPVIFSAVSTSYFRRSRSLSPIQGAAAFLAVVVFSDLVVVATLIGRSFAMLRSVLGTWLPFVLIFTSSWWTGRVVRRTVRFPL